MLYLSVSPQIILFVCFYVYCPSYQSDYNLCETENLTFLLSNVFPGASSQKAFDKYV